MTQILDLHDWLLCSIELGQGKATFGFSDPNSTDSRKLVADGVRHLVCDDLREGNIVLSVDAGIEYASDKALNRLLYITSETPTAEEQEQLLKLRRQLESSELQFIQLVPSYGADVVMAVKSFSLSASND